MKEEKNWSLKKMKDNDKLRLPSYVTEIPLPRCDFVADFQILSVEEEMLMRRNVEKKEEFQTKLLDEIRCRFCSSKNVIKRGLRKTKYLEKQLYECKDCGRTFTPEKVKGKSYPLKYIIEGLSLYNRGFTLKETINQLKENYGLKVSKSTLSDWLEEFKSYCPYSRMREHGKQLFSPHQVVDEEANADIRQEE